MDIEKYSHIGFEIENHIRKAYRDAFEVLKESDNPIECLEKLCLVFEAFEKSRPAPEEGLVWAKHIISAYRNLGTLLISTYRNLGTLFTTKQEDSRIKEFEIIKSEYEALESNHRTFLSDLLGEKENLTKMIDDALCYFKKIEDVLKEHGIEDDDGLEKALSKNYDIKKFESSF